MPRTKARDVKEQLGGKMEQKKEEIKEQMKAEMKKGKEKDVSLTHVGDTGMGLSTLFDFFPAWTQRWGLPDVGRMFAGTEIKLEEYRENGTLVVRAELPGVDPERDIDVTVHDGLLSIRAERSDSSRSEDKGHFQSEFRYGAFSRTLPLPSGASADDVAATYKDGILEVRLPVDDNAPRTKKVSVARS